MPSVTPARSPCNGWCLERAIYSASWASESHTVLSAVVALLSALPRFSIGVAGSVQATAV